MGLMQLMPAPPGDRTQVQHPLAGPQTGPGAGRTSSSGAAYPSQVHGQFNGNRCSPPPPTTPALAVAPVAARRRPPGVRRDGENIPFDETRQYVQNVLSYSVIYGQKLGSPQKLVDWHERFFDDQ